MALTTRAGVAPTLIEITSTVNASKEMKCILKNVECVVHGDGQSEVPIPQLLRGRY